MSGGVSEFQNVRVGVNDADGNATGKATILSGDLTHAAAVGGGSVFVGVTLNDTSTANADGELSVAGNISDFSLLDIGSSAGSGSATGKVTVGGSYLGTGRSSLSIGITVTALGTGDGMAEFGTGISGVDKVQVGTAFGGTTQSATGVLDVLAGGVQSVAPFSLFGVGRTLGDALGMGTSTITGGISGFRTTDVGVVAGMATGNATGSLILIDGDLMGTNLNVGTSDGTGTGTFNLNGNLAVLSDTMTRGDGSTIQLDIDGILRGIDYGAIDTNTAILDGSLDVLFSFDPMPGVFDLIVSDLLNGIIGDFDAVNIMGLAPGTLVTCPLVRSGSNASGSRHWRG